jgi:hypothetical protein
MSVATCGTFNPGCRGLSTAHPGYIGYIGRHSGAPRSGEPGIHNQRPVNMDSGLAPPISGLSYCVRNARETGSALAAASIDAPSPTRTRVYPSSAFFRWPKSDKSDFGSGEGCSDVQRRRRGEGFASQEAFYEEEPLTRRWTLQYRAALSRKGRGHNYERLRSRHSPDRLVMQRLARHTSPKVVTQ